MFGDMMGMMTKLKEAQANVEAAKKRMDSVSIQESSSDKLLKVEMTANKVLKAISIDNDLLEDKEQLEDYLILTINKAIEKATEIHDAEVGAVAKEGMPNIPGLDMFK